MYFLLKICCLVVLLCYIRIHGLENLYLDTNRIRHNDSNYVNNLQNIKWGEDCPNADDIDPCMCQYDVNWGVSMYCYIVSDEEEFADIFNSYFPVINYDILNIRACENLNRLDNDVFHNLTFEYIYFTQTFISDIGPETFIKSTSTLWYVDMSDGKLTNDGFPFDTIPQYKALRELTLMNNEFSEFPIVKSDYLEKLDLSHNNFSEIKREYFEDLPNLKYIGLRDNNIHSILPDTFTILTNLEHLDLGWNKLKTLPANLIHMKEPGLVYVPYNEIRTVEPNSMSGVDRLEIQYNKVRVLHEESWRQIFEQVDTMSLLLFENPISCRCSMLWLAQNETLKSKLDSVKCNLLIGAPMVCDVVPEDLGDCNQTTTTTQVY